MQNVQPFSMWVVKIAVGVFCSFLFLSYQPSLSFPAKQNVVRAQAEQVQSVESQTLPLKFQLPHPGYLSTPFSNYHPGIDLASGLGIPLKAIEAGKVTSAGYNFWGLGLTVTVDHGYGFSSLYAHLGKTYVQKDQQISTSDYIGEVGLTGHTSGPHTHLEIYKEGATINPLTILPEVRQFPTAEDFKPVGGKNTNVSIFGKTTVKKQINSSQSEQGEKLLNQFSLDSHNGSSRPTELLPFPIYKSFK